MRSPKKKAERQRGEKGAGSYRKKGKGYEYRFSVGDKRYSVYAPTIEGCREKENALREMIRKGLYKNNRDITLSEYFEEYIKAKSGSVVEATVLHNRSTFTRVDRALGKKKIRMIESRQVAAFREQLEDEIKDEQSRLTTHGGNDILELLASILNAAVNDGIIERSPAAAVKRFKRIEEDVRSTTHRKLSREEIVRFLEAAEPSYYRYLFEFLLSTGARIGEACALYWTDINFESDEINIIRSVTKTKNGRVKVGDTAKTAAGRRMVPMNDEIRRILRAQRKMTDAFFGVNVSGLVFPGTSGEVARPSSIDTCLKSIARRAGIEHFSAHAFRHTFASNMVDAGVAPEVLKNILGHTNIKITLDTYYHANRDRMREAMDNIMTFKRVV